MTHTVEICYLSFQRHWSLFSTYWRFTSQIIIIIIILTGGTAKCCLVHTVPEVYSLLTLWIPLLQKSFIGSCNILALISSRKGCPPPFFPVFVLVCCLFVSVMSLEDKEQKGRQRTKCKCKVSCTITMYGRPYYMVVWIVTAANAGGSADQVEHWQPSAGVTDTSTGPAADWRQGRAPGLTAWQRPWDRSCPRQT